MDDRAKAAWPVDALSAALVLGALPPFIRAWASVRVRVPLDVNEGWVAYLATRLLRGQPLYGAPDALFINNYPPLSFHALALAARSGTDIIAAGRVVSLVAFAACAVLVYCCALALGASRDAARLSGAVFIASFVLFTHYVGICDPQLFAHGVACCALLLALHRTPGRVRAVASGALFAVSLGIKHNLVAMPLTIGAWYVIRRRDLAVWWCAGFAVACVAVVASTPDVLALARGILTPRQFFPSDVLAALLRWSLYLGSLLAVAAGARGGVVAWTIAVGFMVGIVSKGGAGVDSNAMFECLIALAIGVGVGFDQAPRKGVALALCALPFCVGFARHARGEWLDAAYWLTPRKAEARAAGAVVEAIAERPGRALCHNLALCFWAGKPEALDMFNVSQQIATGTRDATQVVEAVLDPATGAVLLAPGETSLFGADLSRHGFVGTDRGQFGTLFVRGQPR